MPVSFSQASLPIAAPPTPFFQPQQFNSSGQNPQQVIAAADAAATVNSMTYLASQPKYYFQLWIGDYSRGSAFTTTTIDTKDGITLPLPSNIVDNHGVQYDQSPLGVFIGTGLNEYLKTTKSATDLIGAAITSSIPGSIGGPLSTVTGYSPNQFLTILLRGPQYKTHSFNWNLAPRNAIEARNLKNIIRKLHNSAAPSVVEAGFLFKFPKIFQLAFMPNSQYLLKFKPAVLTGITVDYTSGGAPSFLRALNDPASGGVNPPSHVALSMKFLELEFWLQNDFSDSADPFDVHGSA
jgi:hypothetical protein